MIKIETVVKAPFESAFFQTPEMREFSFQFRFEHTGSRHVMLFIGGNLARWPSFHVMVDPVVVKLYRCARGLWDHRSFPVRQGEHHVIGNYFRGVMELFIDGVLVHVESVDLPSVASWSVGVSPYMQGTPAYDTARIWDVEVRSEKMLLGPSLLDRDVPLNYAALDLFESKIGITTDPAVLLLDVDDLTLINGRNGWQHADHLMEALYACVKKVMGDWNTSISHYKGSNNDEMAVLCDRSVAELLAETARGAVADAAFCGMAAGAITLSIGIGVGAKKFSTLYALAGIALREAKSGGKNRVVLKSAEEYAV